MKLTTAINRVGCPDRIIYKNLSVVSCFYTLFQIDSINSHSFYITSLNLTLAKLYIEYNIRPLFTFF